MRYADELDEQWRDLGQVAPGTASRADLWVLVCGGIAAAAAFAAAFVASSGVAAHASTPPAARTVIIQACPTAVLPR